MSRVASLFSRRVPLYIWLPVVLACAAAGFVASTLRPVRPIPGAPHIPRSEVPSQGPTTASPLEQPTRTAESQLSRALGPPRDAPSITLPEEVGFPAPAPTVAKLHERAPEAVGESAAPALVTKGRPPQAIAGRTNRSAARGRPPQRTAQQPAKAASTSSAGLKNIPLIGPVFSLFQ
jgi:hypothetical protein